MGAAQIRVALPSDAAAIAAIYNHYVLHTTVTFEEQALPAEEMERRIREVSLRFPWLVCEEGGEVRGYSYAGAWHARAAYRHAAESTVYLHAGATGRGLGRLLYTALLERLEAMGLHRLVGVIALPNAASVALHERLGFEKAGHLSEVGWKFGRWIDVGWWVRAL